jgi:glycosyltransferase involved in cell wall biosynthesis
MDRRGAASAGQVLRSLNSYFVGNVIVRKGLHSLLHALTSIPRELWHLHVVGSLTADRAYVVQIKRLIQSHALDRQVTLHGGATDAQINQLYERCHLYAAPAFEGFGIAYLEAMSFGLPVLASTAGAAHEIVTHGLNGFLVAPGDTDSLTTHLIQLCTQRTQLQDMSHAARARYDRHPTWQASFVPVLPWLELLRR